MNRHLTICIDQALGALSGNFDDPGSVISDPKLGGAGRLAAGHAFSALSAGWTVSLVAMPKTDLEHQYARARRPYPQEYNGAVINTWFVPVDAKLYARGRQFFSSHYWFEKQMMEPGAFLKKLKLRNFYADLETSRLMAEFAADPRITPVASANQISQVHAHDGQNVTMGLYLPALMPDVRSLYFGHSAENDAAYLRSLPKKIAHVDEVARPVYSAMAAFDTILTHTDAWSQNFLDVCRYLEVPVREESVGSALGTVDPVAVLETFNGPKVQGDENGPGALQEVKDVLGDRFSIVVDGRAEPYKNIPMVIEGAKHLFRIGQLDPRETAVVLLTGGTRLNVAEYAAYWRDFKDAVDQANLSAGFQPADPRRPFLLADGGRYEMVLAHLARCHVHITPPKNDGMNMMQRECALVNQVGFVQAMSRSAGVYDALRPLPDDQRMVLDLNPSAIVTDYVRAEGRFDVRPTDVLSIGSVVLEAQAMFTPERSPERVRAAQMMYNEARYTVPVSQFHEFVRAADEGYAAALRADPERATRRRAGVTTAQQPVQPPRRATSTHYVPARPSPRPVREGVRIH